MVCDRSLGPPSFLGPVSWPVEAHDDLDRVTHCAVEAFESEYAYDDFEGFRPVVKDCEGIDVIPTKRYRNIQLTADGCIYSLHKPVERCFSKLMNAHCLATRCDETASSYRGFDQGVSIRHWTKHFGNMF